MTDRELLELAAKAAGYEIKIGEADGLISSIATIDGWRTIWNPLNDDGDALKLAVKLRLSIEHHNDISQPLPWLRIEDRAGRWTHMGTKEFAADPHAATRRAIVRAAAEIGKAKP